MTIHEQVLEPRELPLSEYISRLSAADNDIAKLQEIYPELVTTFYGQHEEVAVMPGPDDVVPYLAQFGNTALGMEPIDVRGRLMRVRGFFDIELGENGTEFVFRPGFGNGAIKLGAAHENALRLVGAVGPAMHEVVLSMKSAGDGTVDGTDQGTAKVQGILAMQALTNEPIAPEQYTDGEAVLFIADVASYQSKRPLLKSVGMAALLGEKLDASRGSTGYTASNISVVYGEQRLDLEQVDDSRPFVSRSGTETVIPDYPLVGDKVLVGGVYRTGPENTWLIEPIQLALTDGSTERLMANDARLRGVWDGLDALKSGPGYSQALDTLYRTAIVRYRDGRLALDITDAQRTAIDNRLGQMLTQDYEYPLVSRRRTETLTLNAATEDLAVLTMNKTQFEKYFTALFLVPTPPYQIRSRLALAQRVLHGDTLLSIADEGWNVVERRDIGRQDYVNVRDAFLDLIEGDPRHAQLRIMKKILLHPAANPQDGYGVLLTRFVEPLKTAVKNDIASMLGAVDTIAKELDARCEDRGIKDVRTTQAREALLAACKDVLWQCTFDQKM